MKNFQIKQKMWSLGGRFTIQDEMGLPAYQVEGSFFQIPKTFTIRDMQGRFVSQIEKQLLTFLPKFKVKLADGTAFSLRQEWTFFKPRYQIDDLNITVQGDLWNMDFELSQNGQVIARISQEWLCLVSTYKVQIYDDGYADLVISLVIAIDYVKEMATNSSASS